MLPTRGHIPVPTLVLTTSRQQFRLKLKASRKLTAVKRYDVGKLSDPLVASQYEAEVSKRLAPIIYIIKSEK